jgi:hypothetical protein
MSKQLPVTVGENTVGKADRYSLWVSRDLSEAFSVYKFIVLRVEEALGCAQHSGQEKYF